MARAIPWNFAFCIDVYFLVFLYSVGRFLGHHRSLLSILYYKVDSGWLRLNYSFTRLSHTHTYATVPPRRPLLFFAVVGILWLRRHTAFVFLRRIELVFIKKKQPEKYVWWASCMRDFRFRIVFVSRIRYIFYIQLLRNTYHTVLSARSWMDS